MKAKKLEVLLVDHDGSNPVTAQILPALFRARELARGRKQSRSAVSNRMVAKGYPEYRRPHPESWRHSLARYLRRVLPAWCCLYVGGHHIAIHARRPAVDSTEMGVCLARFGEATPI